MKDVDLESASSVSSEWMPAPSALSARSLVQLSGNSMRDRVAEGALLELPPGAAAVPLHLVMGLPRLMLCFRCAPKDGQHSPLLWSRPLCVPRDSEEQHYVVVPVMEEEGLRASGGGDGVALLRLAMHTRGPGMLHIVLETVNADPPFLLENRTPYPLQYRQVCYVRALVHALHKRP